MNVDVKFLNKILINQIPQYVKISIQHKPVGFTPNVQGWFNIWKSTNKMHHISKMSLLLFSFLRLNIWYTKLKKKMYFTSQFVEVSGYSWVVPRQGDRAEECCREVSVHCGKKARKPQTSKQSSSSNTAAFSPSLLLCAGCTSLEQSHSPPGGPPLCQTKYTNWVITHP